MTEQSARWLPIESAPTDGREVWVKRVYEGRVVKEGWAVFGVAAAEAPQRQPVGLDPLGRVSAAMLAEETRLALAHADKPKWLIPDRMYSFPTPTHWRSE